MATTISSPISMESLATPSRMPPARVPRLKYRHATHDPDRAQSTGDKSILVQQQRPSGVGEPLAGPNSISRHQPEGPSIHKSRQGTGEESSISTTTLTTTSTASTPAAMSSPTAPSSAPSGDGSKAGSKAGPDPTNSSALPPLAKSQNRPTKKTSRLKSFFAVKEPSLLALGQVEAQLIAQHGSACPAKVPNVRMEKMPDYVPKVNSKWDGIPDHIKAKQKLEAQKQKARKRMSLKSQNTDLSSQRRTDQSRTQTPNSPGSRPKSMISQRSELIQPNPHRFYARSCNSSGDLAAQQRLDTPKHSEHSENGIESTHSLPLSPPTPPAPRSPQSPRFHPSSRATAAEFGPAFSRIENNASTTSHSSNTTELHHSAVASTIAPLYAPAPALSQPVPRPFATERTPERATSSATRVQKGPMSAAPVGVEASRTSAPSTGNSLDDAIKQFEGRFHSRSQSRSQPRSHRPSTKPVNPANPASEGFLAGEAQEVVVPEVDNHPPSRLGTIAVTRAGAVTDKLQNQKHPQATEDPEDSAPAPVIATSRAAAAASAAAIAPSEEEKEEEEEEEAAAPPPAIATSRAARTKMVKRSKWRTSLLLRINTTTTKTKANANNANMTVLEGPSGGSGDGCMRTPTLNSSLNETVATASNSSSSSRMNMMENHYRPLTPPPPVPRNSFLSKNLNGSLRSLRS